MKNERIKILFYVFILLFGLKISLNLTLMVRGGSFYLWYFDTDGETYYIDGDIEINATWDLSFDPLLEQIYFQVQIYNFSNGVGSVDYNQSGLIWNSSRYNKAGNYDESWVVNIPNLNLPDESSQFLFVRFFYHCYHKITMDQEDIVLEEIQIQVIKKELSCQLIGFTDRLRNGNNLTFKARFYDSLLENSNNLINQIVLLKILNNGQIVFDCNYTTNTLGIINITVYSFTYLKIGQNYLILEIENNKYYNNSYFYYDFFVEEITSHAINPLQLSVFSFASILAIASIIFIIISNSNKNAKQRTLSEITFRY